MLISNNSLYSLSFDVITKLLLLVEILPEEWLWNKIIPEFSFAFFFVSSSTAIIITALLDLSH